jgi:hypothetical protein
MTDHAARVEVDGVDAWGHGRSPSWRPLPVGDGPSRRVA